MRSAGNRGQAEQSMGSSGSPVSLPPTRVARGGEGHRRPSAAVLLKHADAKHRLWVGGGSRSARPPTPAHFTEVKFADPPHRCAGGEVRRRTQKRLHPFCLLALVARAPILRPFHSRLDFPSRLVGLPLRAASALAGDHGLAARRTRRRLRRRGCGRRRPRPALAQRSPALLSVLMARPQCPPCTVC